MQGRHQYVATRRLLKFGMLLLLSTVAAVHLVLTSANATSVKKLTCLRDDDASSELFALADQDVDELIFTRIVVRADDRRRAARLSNDHDSEFVAVSLNRDVIRATVQNAEVTVVGDAGAIQTSGIHCVAYREAFLVLTVLNTGDALASQPVFLSIGSGAAQRTFVGRTPALPSRTSIPLLLAADEAIAASTSAREDLRSTEGGPPDVVLSIGSP